MKNMKRSVALLVAIALLIGCAAGGTMAWLMQKTDTITNTFTVGNINIELKEHEYNSNDNTLKDTLTTSGVSNYKMIPGITLPKDPIVTVSANSEKCYLFVEVKESANFDTYMTYTMANNWLELDNVDGVYYRIVNSDDEIQSFAVLNENEVTVPDTITKAQMDALQGVAPSLKFTAYAVQYEFVTDAATAWGYAQSATYDENGANNGVVNP